MPWFERPVAISSRISRSRGVNLASGIVRSLPLESERRDDDRVESRSAVGDPPDGGNELVDVSDPVLEQVSDTLGRVREQLQREAELDVLREHEHADRRVRRADLERRTHPLVSVGRRQPDVDDRDLG